MSQESANDNVLVLYRKREWVNYFRAYRVLLNDREVAQIRNGEQISVTVPHGPNHLRLAIDWCGSNTLDISCASANLAIECGCRVTGWELLRNLGGAFQRNQDYLWLRIKQ